MGSEKTQLVECTGWTDAEESWIHRCNGSRRWGKVYTPDEPTIGSWWTSVQLSREFVFQSSHDNHTHRLNRRSIGWLPIHATASFWGRQFSITGWTDDGYWRCVGLTGVKYFSSSFSPTAIFSCAAYIYPQGRVIWGCWRLWKFYWRSTSTPSTILSLVPHSSLK